MVNGHTFPHRRPRRRGWPPYLYKVEYRDGSIGWYYPDDKIPDHLFRDRREDVAVSIVYWD